VPSDRALRVHSYAGVMDTNLGGRRARDPEDAAEQLLAPGSLVLVTGASGYIGARLVPELLDAGYRVRCLVRTPAKIEHAEWLDRVQIVAGDVEGDLTEALEGVDAAYYLIHAIGASPDWVERDRRSAENFARAADKARTSRIVYLGGLGAEKEGQPLSAHLASRHEVGAALGGGSAKVTELRAAVVIGAGSASFEMLRYLVEVLPVMITPRWVDTRCQPIAIGDLLRCLLAVLGRGDTAGRTIELGGPDILTYRKMMSVYAEEAGLRRRIIVPVPVLTPGLSSHWVGLVTPLPRSLAIPLVNSLVNEVIVSGDGGAALLGGHLTSYRESVALALGTAPATDGPRREDDAARPVVTDPGWAGGSLYVDRRQRHVDASAAAAFGALTSIGGENGWYSGHLLWEIRGLLDIVVGGPGMRRNVLRTATVAVDSQIDFWRVEAVEEDSLLVLFAEMKMPGEAWLEWRIVPDGDGGCTLFQEARFRPRGLLGRAYWYCVAPFHQIVFPGMLEGIAGAAEASVRTENPPATLEGPERKSA